MNRVELRGGLIRDGEIRQAGPSLLCTFTLAVNGTKYNGQTRQQEVKTTFVTCQAWALLAEEMAAIGGLHQGDDVWLVGELDQYRKSDDDKPSTRVTVFDYRVLRSRHLQDPMQTAPSSHEGTQQPSADPWR